MLRRVIAAVALAATLVPPASARRPALRGVVEGYYGRPWTGAARRDVIRFLGARGMNAFLYAPKNDEFHRTRWRDPYPENELADLRETAIAARRSAVRFIYGLSPVLDVCYSCPADFDALTGKLDQLVAAGVRRFALLFDDGGRIAAPEDATRYGGTDEAALARAQGDLANRVRGWLRGRGRLVLVVPSDYYGTDCHPYHAALAGALARRLPVAWTGSGVFAPTITTAEARARAACVPGHPVVLWDNYPVNDTALSNNLHLGPLVGRDAGLPRVLAGYLLNPMTQAHASLVALGTAAAYLRDPKRYDPERVWGRTLARLSGGGTGLGVLAAQTRSSFLDLRDARELSAAIEDVTATYDSAAWEPAVTVLAAEEARQAAAPDDIAARLGGTPLGEEIAPWVVELGAHAARGMEAVLLLTAMKPALADVVAGVSGDTLRVTGRALGPDFDTAARLGPGFAADTATIAARTANPPVGPYLACLGDLLGPSIRLCPEFGLNVHGKALYFVVRSPADIEVVTDRNVHDRLVGFTGAAYTAWSGGLGPGFDALGVTLDGAPVALGPGGEFDVTVARPAAPVALVVMSGAGGRTERLVP